MTTVSVRPISHLTITAKWIRQINRPFRFQFSLKKKTEQINKASAFHFRRWRWKLAQVLEYINYDGPRTKVFMKIRIFWTRCQSCAQTKHLHTQHCSSQVSIPCGPNLFQCITIRRPLLGACKYSIFLSDWSILSLNSKEHYHVFAHAREFDFRTGGQEFKDAGIDIELSQIRLHRPQSTLALP